MISVNMLILDEIVMIFPMFAVKKKNNYSSEGEGWHLAHFQGFPQAISDGVRIYISDPHLFPLMEGQPKISQKLSSVRKRTENL